jgi:hypothetical protein
MLASAAVKGLAFVMVLLTLSTAPALESWPLFSQPVVVTTLFILYAAAVWQVAGPTAAVVLLLQHITGNNEPHDNWFSGGLGICRVYMYRISAGTKSDTYSGRFMDTSHVVTAGTAFAAGASKAYNVMACRPLLAAAACAGY